MSYIRAIRSWHLHKMKLWLARGRRRYGVPFVLLLTIGTAVLLSSSSSALATNSLPPTITVQSGNPTLPSIPNTVLFDVTNPQGNNPLTGLIVRGPVGWTMNDCYSGTLLNEFTVNSTSCTYDYGSGGGSIPAGGSDVLGIQVTPPVASGTYPYTGTLQTMVNDTSTTTFYSGPTLALTVMDPTTSIAVAVYPGDGNTATNYFTGSTPYTLAATVACSTSSACPTGRESGLQVLWSATYTPSSASFSFGPASGLTNSVGQTATTFQPSNNPGDSGTVRAFLGTSGLISSPTAAITTVASPTTSTTSTVTSTASTTSTGITTSSVASSTGAPSSSSTYSITTTSSLTTSQTSTSFLTTTTSSASATTTIAGSSSTTSESVTIVTSTISTSSPNPTPSSTTSRTTLSSTTTTSPEGLLGLGLKGTLVILFVILLALLLVALYAFSRHQAKAGRDNRPA